MKRKYIYSFLLTIAIGSVSCKKYLNVVPNNAIASEDAIIDAGTARAAIIGTYDRVQSYYASYTTLGIMPADNVIFNGTLSEYLQLDQNAVPVDNVITVGAYQGLYRTVNSANSVIAKVPGVNDPLLSSDEKNKILGEAYFLRALAYFDLGRAWGGVQIQLNPTTSLDAIKGVTRSTLDQTYDQVLSDLNKAEQLLPEDAATRNRAQKSTARALRARLHLYRKQWADAEADATLVINNTKYSLVKPYKSFFTSPFLSNESVFELTFTTNDKNSYWGFWYPSSSGGSFTIKPATGLVTKLNDPTIGGDRKALIAGTSPNVYGVLYNTVGVSTDPFYLIRISELYLIRAEARAQQNNLAGALSDLNAVRNRASVTNATATTQAAILQAIEDENSVEFPFEPHRWFDLVRTGRAQIVLGITNPNYLLFPLPGSDVLSDPDLGGKNNPGY